VEEQRNAGTMRHEFWGEWLSDERRFWMGSTLFLGVLAGLKGLRRPSLWAVTQAQVDYSFGFIKRGLTGVIFNKFEIHHYAMISLYFYLTLLIFLLALAVLVHKSGMTQRNGTYAVVTVFAGSYALTYLVHLVGYTDILNGIFTIGLLLIRRPLTRFILGAGVFCVAMLIHENFLLVYVPLLLLSFVLQSVTDTGKRWQYMGFAFSLGALALGLTVFTTTKARMTLENAQRLEQHTAARVDFPLEHDFFKVPAVSLWENFKRTVEIERISLRWRREMLVAPFVLLPCFAIFVRRCFALIEASSVEGHLLLMIRICVAVSIFSPLVLYCMGFDAMRWNVLCVLDAFLTLAILSLYLPGRNLVLNITERNAIILVIAIGMASGYGLLDKSTVRPFPFFIDNPGMVWDFLRHGILPPPAG
jgi:hypothetical protein